jgi:hypothetical protein
MMLLRTIQNGGEGRPIGLKPQVRRSWVRSIWSSVCVELALAMPRNTGTTVKLECGSESFTLPFVVEGIAISWSDPFVMMPLRESYLEDGGLGTIADISGCSPSCRGPALEDTSEMEIFVGLNPGFSLSKFEQEEKALKKQKATQSKPNP